MNAEDKSAERLALAHRMLEVSRTEMWRETILPYLERERFLQIELMASMTDALQLMRYAGAIQAIGNLILLEECSRQAIDAETEKKLGRFKSGPQGSR